MLTIGVELGADRSDGSVWVKGVDADGAWARAGGAAGDLCTTIDGEPAGQVVARWQDGSRLRTAGEQITVELERLGRRLEITLHWEEIESAEVHPHGAGKELADDPPVDDDEELTEAEEEEFFRVAKSAKAARADAAPAFRLPQNRFDRIDPRLDPRPTVGPVQPNQPHLRVYGPSKRVTRDKRVEDVIEWQRQKRQAAREGICVDETYDPLSFEVLDRDRDVDGDWWNESNR
jgi:hypothetical protein